MVAKPIQEQFGQRLMEVFAEFARADLDPPAHLEAHEFAHVEDAELRSELARVYYGARWIYKLGLALLVRDEERAAHVRAQIVDYATVAEGLLTDALAHAIRSNQTKGAAWRFSDLDRQQKAINWTATNLHATLARQSFWWLIRVAQEFGIVRGSLTQELNWLRDHRNSVHLRERSAIGKAAFLNQSKRAFETVGETIRQTKIWRVAHASPAT